MGSTAKKRKGEKQHLGTLEQARKRFDESWDYAEQNWHAKWERDNKLYDNERVMKQYKGVTDTFVPMTFSTVETVVTALNNANLRFDFDTQDPLRSTSTAPLNALIDEWWDADQWDLAFEENEREMLITGMAPFMLSWEGDRPHLDHFSMKDAIVDPTVKNPYDLQQPGSYAGRRYFVRKDTLDEYEIVDTDEKSNTYGEMVKRFTVPPDDGTGAPTKDDDKAEKEMYSGSTLSNPAEDQDEIIEIWDVDRVVTLWNRKHVIEDRENPYKERHRTMLTRQYQETGLSEEDAKTRAELEATGLVPFFYFRNYRRTSLFYAKSEIDAIAKSQEQLNDQRNMEADAIIRQLSPQRELDPKYMDWLELVDQEPDVTYPFVPGSLQYIQPMQVPANSFNSQMNIKNEIRETSSIDQLAKGMSNQVQTTATEIREQSANTSERIESKARILEKDGLYWMGHILFRMFQLYVDEPLVIEVKGADTDGLKTTVTMPDGTERPLPPGTALLDPADYQGEWRPKVTLEIDAKTKKAEEQQVARENYMIVVQDPTNNLQEAKKILYPKMFDLTADEVEAITTPPEGAATSGMPPGMPGAEQPPEGEVTPPMPAEVAPEQSLEDVDQDALAQYLTPEEWQQLQEALAAEGVPV